MKYISVFLILFTAVISSAQQTIESTNAEFKMKQGNTDRIIMNSGPNVFFQFPASININDIFGDSRISLIGNDFIKFRNPNVLLTGNIELDSTYTLFRLRNELHSGTWGIGLGAYREFSNNLNSFNITLEDEPVLQIDEDGDVFIESLKSQSGELRPLYVDNDGKISDFPVTRDDYRILYSEFTANDGDASEVEIVRLGRTPGFGYVRHDGNFSDEGELVAPIHIPDGSRISRLLISYVNKADADELYQIQVLQAPIQPSASTTIFSNWRDIPVGGEILPASGFLPERVNGATHSIALDMEIDTFSFIYSLIVRCENCSEQYLRSVSILYTPPG